MGNNLALRKSSNVHIRFNTVDKFKKVDVKKDNVNQHIMRLQSARTVREYERNIETLKEMFPVGIPSGSGGKPTEEFVWTYLQEIHPTSWTVLGNSDLSDGETAWLKENWKDTSSYGFGLPLFGHHVTAKLEERAELEGEEAKLPSTKQQWTDAIVEEGYDEHDATPTIYKFSHPTSRLRAHQTGAYYCTKCNKPGHNARTCRFTSQEVKEAGVLIVPGVYVLGESPLGSLRIVANGVEHDG
ncbi:uncharacterized protein PITG_06073 [Phytophthora infestans T30-4]|uniref:CCHC-type domain-containing protein n=1 Tax=Phytophthora infestans (strain T30-4) TaxID=403677 RepID=D0N6C1_PHYIT|nr:uncharacterized protein PITG_06073 [Phytophthora infestans T30-4]EEY70612.1 conserved hypothetical protein [Phytophthora infestans T30-4]|eukprot:XP_002998266.1 conserved hypothetical protein [Phytophthora infestans T30-4]